MLKVSDEAIYHFDDFRLKHHEKASIMPLKKIVADIRFVTLCYLDLNLIVKEALAVFISPFTPFSLQKGLFLEERS